MGWFIRLDDGSLIGKKRDLGLDGEGAVRLSPEEAEAHGKLTEEDVTRLVNLVQKASEATTPAPFGAPPTATLQTSVANKKPRPSTSQGAGGSGGSEWVSKCQRCLQPLYSHLGKNKNVFYEPVSAAVVPSYYSIIKHPICFKEIEMKLGKRQYESPQAFAADVERVWENCRIFNPIGDPFRAMGDKAAAVWAKTWAGSGLANVGPPLAPADQHADPYSAPQHHMAPGRAHANKQPMANGAGASMGAPPGAGEGISDERRQEIAHQLGSLDEHHLEGLTSLLPAHMLDGGDGELELDFDKLDDATLHKIDAFLRNIFPPQDGAGGGTAAPPSPSATHNPSVKLDEESDYLPESDDDE